MAADKLTGELHAMQDWYRECVWHPANFASWRRTTLEPAWRHDALEQYDGWSPDLADRADAWACEQDDAEYEALVHAEYQAYMQSEQQQQYYDSLGREDLWRQWGPWR